MKTRLYNTNTQEFTSQVFKGGYFIDGQKPALPEGIVELEQVQPVEPTFDEATQRLERSKGEVDLQAGTYTRFSYQVIDLSAEEIAEKEKQEYLAGLNWGQLEDDLEQTPLPSSPTESYFLRAVTCQNPNAYALLMSCFNGRWDARLEMALNGVKDSMPTPLTMADVDKLNAILANNNFDITIPY